MIVEGVSFNDELVRAMKKKDFIAECHPVFFLDRDEESSRRMLSDIYDRIKGDTTPNDDKDTLV